MKLTALILTLGVCLPVCTSTAMAATDNNANAWFMYFGDHAIAKTPWGIHLEGQWRRTDVSLLKMAGRKYYVGLYDEIMHKLPFNW